MIPHRPREGSRIPGAERSDDTAVVRGLYMAVAEENHEALAPYMDPEVAWVHPLVARLPFDGTARGPQAVMNAAFRRRPGGTGPRVSAETFLEWGDGVLVVGRFLGDDPEPFLHECHVQGGRVVMIRGYTAR